MFKKVYFLISFVLVLALATGVSAQTLDDLELHSEYLFDPPDPCADTGPGDYNLSPTDLFGGATLGEYSGAVGRAYRAGLTGCSWVAFDCDAISNWVDKANWTLELMFYAEQLPVGGQEPALLHGNGYDFTLLDWREIEGQLYAAIEIYCEPCGDWYTFTADDTLAPDGQPGVAINLNQWHHFVFSMDGSGPISRIWIDGELIDVEDGWECGSSDLDDPTGVGESEAWIGNTGGWCEDEEWVGRIDELRFYVGYTEIPPPSSLYNGARNPRPADNATRVSPDNLRLIWDKDPCAAPASESVYFGTSFADVNGRQPAADKGIQDANYYPTTGYLSVDLGQTYYWAIDEVVDACAAPGPVWQFTTKTTKADLPSPKDNADYVGPCPTLTWDPGYGAVTHKVYFDVNEAKVAGRTIDPCAVINEPNEESYTPGALAWDTEYFWAVDEVNASAVTTSGDVWSFTVGPDPTTDVPAWRSTTDTLYAKWGFDVNWPAGEPCKPVADPNWVIPSDPNWEPNCVDKPYAWLASYMGRSGIADNNDPVANEEDPGYRSIRFKHNDYAIPGQNVIVRAAIIWTGASRPSITLERLTGWGAGPEPEDGWEAWEETDPYKNSDEPDPLYEYQLCDGWMYSVYEVEFETLEAADNIHVVVSNDGELYLDSVVVDAHWYTTPWARAPSPWDGAEDVRANLCKLTWYPGAWIADTNGHDVYFGTDFNDVNDATTSVDPNNVYMGPQDTTSYPEVGCLDLKFSTTYYWRIDEVNDACAPYLWKGAVWSFTTASWFVVEDAEVYADTTALRAVWTQSNGAELFLETGDADRIYGGDKSMRFAYRNPKSGGQYKGSEAVASTTDLEVSPDWTQQGVKALVLHFQGDPGNGQTGEFYAEYHITNDQMYVAVEDGSAKVGIVKYDTEHDYDMNDILEAEWQEWNIDLAEPCLADVNMANVVKVYIGFGGAKTGQSAGGAGEKTGNFDTVWFDDIELHPVRCVPAYSWPYGDIDEDCNVFASDLEAISADWLVTDYEVPPVAPNDANLIVEYLFDNYSDTSGPPYYHGQESASGATVSGGVLTLDGVGYVDIGNDFNSLGLFGGTQDFSISMWFKTSAYGILISSSEPNDTSGCDMSMNVYVGEYVNPGEVLYDNVGIGWMGASTLLNDGQWHHMATTYDAATLQHHIYADGVPEEWAGDEGLMDDIWDPNITDIATHTVRIGWTYCDDALDSSAQYVGDINDVRIYDFALTHSHVLALAGRTDMQYFPLDLLANLVPKDPCDSEDPNLGSGVYDPNNLDIINFKDYAVMANNWLVGPILWPPQP